MSVGVVEPVTAGQGTAVLKDISCLYDVKVNAGNSLIGLTIYILLSPVFCFANFLIMQFSGLLQIKKRASNTSYHLLSVKFAYKLEGDKRVEIDNLLQDGTLYGPVHVRYELAC